MTIKIHIWDQIKEDFRTEIPRSEFQTWLAKTSLKEITAGHATIEVPNKFIARWLQDNYMGRIQTVFKNSLNTLPEIRFSFSNVSEDPQTPAGGVPTAKDVHFLHGVDTSNTFADFVTDSSNRLAYSSAVSVAQHPAVAYNPLYIYSKLGIGKTHMLNGIGNLALKNNPSAKIMYMPAERFVTEFASNTDNEPPVRFWEMGWAPDFLLFDDIHRLAGHWKSQAELLALCGFLLESSRQLVVAAHAPPANIRYLLPELRSRLEWGLIAEIHPPGQRAKLKIIKKTANKEKMRLPDDVAFFLSNTSDDISTLLHYLRLIKDYVSTHRRTPAAIDISVCESIIQTKAFPPQHVDIAHIQRITAKYFNISLADLLSSKREKGVSYPRQIGMYLSKKLTTLSLKEIGLAFGNRHHSTVIYAENRIRKTQKNTKSVSRDLGRIEKLLS